MTSIKLPEQNNYEISKDRAIKVISERTTEEIVNATGGFLKKELLFFNFFSYEVNFDFTNKKLNLPESLVKSKSTEGLILHYIAYSKGTKPSNEWIQFYQIKDASLYLPVFTKRTVSIISKVVHNLEQFINKSVKLGGTPIEFTSSATAFKFQAFPLFPVLLVFYEGDDEIPSEMKFLFDAKAISNLPAEDIVVTCQFLSLLFLKP